MSSSRRELKPDIDVIIVHYHAADLVREAFAHLQRDAAHNDLAIRILVADNGSTEDERRTLESLDLIHIPTLRDAGYAGAINAAFPHTTADCIIVMNEDVMVQTGCLRLLSDALNSGAAVAGPEFAWDYDGLFLLPCTEERTRRNEFLRVAGNRSVSALKRARDRWREHARIHWRATQTIESAALSGALLAFRRDTWTTIGPWDEGYHMYFDENDWLARARAAKLRLVYVPSAKAVHLHNPKLAGEADRARWSEASFLRFGSRYYGEQFMRRLLLLNTRQAVLPDWQPLDAEPDGATFEIAIPPTSSWPVWIELTPSPLGYPAAAARVTDPATRSWRLPVLKGLPFLAGTFFVTMVDDSGRELGSFRYVRRSVPADSAGQTRRS